MTRIKICGIMTQEEIRLCVAAGTHALGFVVEYPIDVPWNLDRQTARVLMRSVPPFVTRVIVVGDDSTTVVSLTKLLKPNVVQLHGNEPITVTRRLVSALHGLGVQAVKPLRFSAESGRCHGPCEDPVDAAKSITDTGVDALVLDSVSDARPAGTGQSINWKLARRVRDSVCLPVILAGGLHAGNVGEAITTVNPYGVDVISGIEDSLGKKDPGKIRAFVRAVAAAIS